MNSQRQRFEKVFPIPYNTQWWNGQYVCRSELADIEPAFVHQIRWETWQAATEQGVGEALANDWRLYPCGSTPEIGDIVRRKTWSDTELTVSQVRLGKDCNIRDCSFDGNVCLDTPQDYELVSRAHPPKPTGGVVPEGYVLVPLDVVDREEILDKAMDYHFDWCGYASRSDLAEAARAVAYAARDIATQQPPEQE